MSESRVTQLYRMLRRAERLVEEARSKPYRGNALAYRRTQERIKTYENGVVAIKEALRQLGEEVR